MDLKKLRELQIKMQAEMTLAKKHLENFERLSTGLGSLIEGEVSTSPKKTNRIQQQAALVVAKRNAQIKR